VIPASIIADISFPFVFGMATKEGQGKVLVEGIFIRMIKCAEVLPQQNLDIYLPFTSLLMLFLHAQRRVCDENERQDFGVGGSVKEEATTRRILDVSANPI
jgi:hypothetical protein